MFAQESLNRFESLGDNCELGLVLRALGNENGGFFRWTLCPLESLVKLISDDFANVYRFENLVPHSPIMVRDEAYGLAFHSHMKSTDQDGVLSYLETDEGRRATYQAELPKVEHLIGKFRNRLLSRGTIFVVKKNYVPSAEGVITELVELLAERSGHRDFQVLWVRSNNDKAGLVEQKTANLLLGYLSRFAPYIGAHQFESEEWRSLLAGALSASGAAPASPPTRGDASS